MTSIIRHCDKPPQTPSPPLVAAPHTDRAAARSFARSLGTELFETAPAAGLYLWLDTDGLALCRAGRPPMCMRADFTRGAQGYRNARPGQRREAIARACGIRGDHCPWIVDATAGLGRDAFVLATAGASVTLLERSAVVHALLVDGLQRATAGGAADRTARMDPHHADAVEWLAQDFRDNPPAVVYLDPMYSGQRRAAAGKELALLQALSMPATDESALLRQARATALDRVVVKRHRHARPLADQPPDYHLPGRSTRFDVYRTRTD
ncbi:class I SAM-dependent methyltransferase [Spiribacter vilamensis]|uniref:class I SAM-dependent methyltransferase n=1 Tax=Spiribacter vilamensis TaxID=531306 RepID=UPI0013EEAD45|nr:class I SAM-dependent methyltransferase [Spiribacter vilamensis]